MIDINTDTKQNSVNKLLNDQLANIQTQFDQLNQSLTSLSNSTTANFSTVNTALATCQSLISDMTTTQQATSTSVASLNTALQTLKTELGNLVKSKVLQATNRIEAPAAVLTTVNADYISADTLLDAIEADITTLTTTTLNVENAVIENLETNNLTLSRLDADQSVVQNAVNVATQTVELTTEGIKSNQSYNSVGYDTNDKVEKYKFVLNAGFIAYSTDTDDTWSLTWNGAIEYSNPKLTIKRIDVAFENNENVAYVYFDHPGTDLDFMVLNFGDYDVDISSEVIDKSGAYEEENCGYFGITGNIEGGSSGGGLSPLFVNILPEEGLSSYLYIVANDRSYVWDSNSRTFKELSGNLNAEINARTEADTALGELIAANTENITNLQTTVSTQTSDINSIKAKIPSEATEDNKLADKAFIQTNYQEKLTAGNNISITGNTISSAYPVEEVYSLPENPKDKIYHVTSGNYEYYKNREYTYSDLYNNVVIRLVDSQGSIGAYYYTINSTDYELIDKDTGKTYDFSKFESMEYGDTGRYYQLNILDGLVGHSANIKIDGENIRIYHYTFKRKVGIFSKNIKLATAEDDSVKLEKVNGTATNLEVQTKLTVNGDIIQNGSAYETHAEKVYTKNDMIITRDGAVSGLATGDYTGIQAKKYDGTNDGQLVFDKDGVARVGDVGDTQPLLTRSEAANLTDGQLFKWDATNKKAVGVDVATSVSEGNTSPVTSKAVNDALTYYAKTDVLNWRSYNYQTDIIKALTENWVRIKNNGVYSATFYDGYICNIMVSNEYFSGGVSTIVVTNGYKALVEIFIRKSDGTIDEKGKLTTESDLNDALANFESIGKYYNESDTDLDTFNDNLPNNKFSVANFNGKSGGLFSGAKFTLLCTKMGNYQTQIAISYVNSGDMSIIKKRGRFGNNWGDWQKLTTESDIPKYQDFEITTGTDGIATLTLPNITANKIFNINSLKDYRPISYYFVGNIIKIKAYYSDFTSPATNETFNVRVFYNVN